ncbi:hypothetical protein IC620_10295 [Hazenella sp. IB182357]|uniref:Uncharacterized protein n=1 Tax=Polycladospora coralii TaxID=2771432 RepID=A0A926N6S9_9BACL|nr:hypothetical protein [Polycladospora coralii]MBD1372746.1 hypothetical protein [Polycladospora coralii]
MKKSGHGAAKQKKRKTNQYFFDNSNKKQRRKKYTIFTPRLGRVARKKMHPKLKVYNNSQLGKNKKIGKGDKKQNINNENKMRWFGYGQIGMPKYDIIVVGKHNKPKIKLIQNIHIGKLRYMQDEFFDVNYNA